MIPEATFFFSIAGLSASLAGLAGLVAALRRSSGLGPLDLFRLREIVEFAFANALLAVSIIPLSTALGDTSTGVRLLAVIAGLYLLAHSAVLLRRQRRAAIETVRGWLVVAAVIDLIAFGLAAAALLTGATAALELLLVSMLARPMAAFLLVLGNFEPDRP